MMHPPHHTYSFGAPSVYFLTCRIRKADLACGLVGSSEQHRQRMIARLVGMFKVSIRLACHWQWQWANEREEDMSSYLSLSYRDSPPASRPARSPLIIGNHHTISSLCTLSWTPPEQRPVPKDSVAYGHDSWHTTGIIILLDFFPYSFHPQFIRLCLIEL